MSWFRKEDKEEADAKRYATAIRQNLAFACRDLSYLKKNYPVVYKEVCDTQQVKGLLEILEEKRF